MYLNSFSGVNVIREKGKFITSVYRKPTFSGVYTHFDSFLPDTYKIAMICTIVNRCFQICSSWSMFHQQLILLREIFQKNGYPENFIDRCFKLFLNRIYILKENVPAVEKKPLRLVLPYLRTISLLGLNCKNSSKRTFCPSLSVWMSSCHIACCALRTSVNSFLLILRKLLDFNYQYVKWLDNEQTT